MWLLLPNFNGAKVVYEKALQPLLKEHKDLIQEWINKTTSAASDVQKQAQSEALKAASDPSLISKGLEMHTKIKQELEPTE